MKKIFALIFFILTFNSFANDKLKVSQIKKITEGTYDLIEWRDGDNVFVPPNAIARFIMTDGFLMFTAHKSEKNSQIGYANWGEYKFLDGSFYYGYSNFLTIISDGENIEVTKTPPSTARDMILPNMREFKITHDKDRVKFTFSKATFDFNKQGLVYTDYNTGAVRKYIKAKKTSDQN